jgi:hypothetical protein
LQSPNFELRAINSPKNKTCIVSFFGEQLIPQLFSFFFAGLFLGIILEPKIVAVVGTVFFLYIFGLGLSAIVRFGFIEKNAVQTDVEIGAARLAFIAPRDKFQRNRILALVASFHSLSRRSLRQYNVFPLFPCD